ncbi:MAG: cation transporter [Planctomycetes bacterium]|nr:cation transporter [Planctomycetota bacterium]
MSYSLGIGVAMFFAKTTAYLLTGSAAILSDAAESVVHVVAVGFAAYSLWLSQQPPDRNHLYGHEKVGFFSAGFEGAMIVLAALFIIYESVRKWIVGLDIQNLEVGTLFVAGAAAVNGLLGWYLVRIGNRERSLVLVANGKHVLTDCVTSVGVIVALVLVWLTGVREFDPILAIAIALQILWSGGNLIRQAFRGLMDESSPEIDRVLRVILDAWAVESAGQYHGLRHRSVGNKLWIEMHLLFPGRLDLETVHAAATKLEDQIERELAGTQVVLTTHLEPLEQHEAHHPTGGLQHAPTSR